jgi:hypothetical protein
MCHEKDGREFSHRKVSTFSDLESQVADHQYQCIAQQLSGSVGRWIMKNQADGRNEDSNVESEGPILDIVEIISDAPFGFPELIEFASETVHLCPTGQSWLDTMAQRVGRHSDLQPLSNDLRVQCMRTGTNERHVALEDIEELREFIDAQSSDDPANPRYARIVDAGLLRSAIIRKCGMHRPELPDLERLLIEPGTGLAEEDRTAGLDRHEYQLSLPRIGASLLVDQDREWPLSLASSSVAPERCGL